MDIIHEIKEVECYGEASVFLAEWLSRLTVEGRKCERKKEFEY